MAAMPGKSFNNSNVANVLRSGKPIIFSFKPFAYSTLTEKSIPLECSYVRNESFCHGKDIIF